MGRSIRITSLGNEIDQEKDLGQSICIVLAGRGGVDRMRGLKSAGEEVALSVLKCGDDGGCVWTT